MAKRFPPGWFPKRGEVYLVSLDKARPAIVISTDALNKHALDVCVVPITTIQRKQFTLRVPMQAGEAGLDQNSWAKCDQVTTIEKARLLYPPLGRLGEPTLGRIAESIKLALELT